MDILSPTISLIQFLLNLCRNARLKGPEMDGIIDRAINSTSILHEQFPSLREQLGGWVNSNDFIKFKQMIVTGNGNLKIADLVSSFVHISEFFDNETTIDSATKIIEDFIKAMIQELLTSYHAPLFLAGRIEHYGERTTEFGRANIQATRDSEEKILSRINEFESTLLNHTGEAKVKDSRYNGDEKSFEVRHETAREILQSGNSLEAKRLYLQLKEDIEKEDATNIELRAKIENNLGLCFLEEGDFKAASEHFESGLVLNPNDIKILTNSVMMRLQSGEIKKASDSINRALELDSTNEAVKAIYIRLLGSQGRFDELKLYENKEVSKDVAFSLGVVYSQTGDYGAAEKWFYQCLELEEDPQTMLLLAQVFLQQAQIELEGNYIDGERHDSLPMRRCNEAEHLLTKAIQLFSSRPHKLYMAYQSRSACRLFMGELKNALEDIDKVLEYNEEDVDALWNKIRICFQSRKASIAKEALDKLDKLGEGYKDLNLRFWTLLKNGFSKDAKSILDKSLPPGETVDLNNFSFIAGALIDEQEYDFALDILNRGLEIKEDDVSILVLRAQAYWETGRKKEATHDVKKAIGMLPSESSTNSILPLANAAYQIGEYDDAVDLYEKVNVIGTHLMPRYMDSLTRIGNEEKAYKIAKEEREKSGGTVIPGLTEFEASSLLSVGAFKQACELFSKLIETDPENEFYQINAQIALYRMGERDEATKAMIEYANNHPHSANVLMAAAELASFTGKYKDAIDLSYKALMVEYDNPHIQRAYIGTFLRSDSDGGMLDPPDTVCEDIMVKLKDNSGKEIWIHIVFNTDEKSIATKWVVDTNAAQKLIGCKKEEEFSLETKTYKVLELQTKYVRAFQKVLTEFNYSFPDDQSVHSFDVSDNDFSQMLSIIDEGAKKDSDIVQIYNERKLTLGAIGVLKGKTLIDAHLTMISEPNQPVFVFSGSTVERAYAQSVLNDRSNEIILDGTVIITFSIPGLLSLLLEIKRPLIVSQLTLDEFKRCYDQNLSSPRPKGFLSKKGDKYIHHEYTNEDQNSFAELLSSHISFIEQHCEVVPAVGALDGILTNGKKLRKVLGEAQFGALVACKERNAILLSDDQGFRDIAQNDYRIPGCWSQITLNYFKEMGIITSGQYSECVKEMIKYGYKFIWVDEDIIWHQLDKDCTTICTDAELTLKSIESPDVTEDSAVEVAANLLQRVWLEAGTTERRLLILKTIIESLVLNRSPKYVLRKLNRNLETKFALLPIQLEEVKQEIARLASIHFWDTA